MSSVGKPESAREIEQEAELARARLASTLDQLRDNLTPRHLADELIGDAREAAQTVAKALGDSAADHPIPAVLIGAACAMLFSTATGLMRPSAAPGRGSAAPSPARASMPVAGVARPTPRTMVAQSRWKALGERPLATAIIGMAIGRLAASMLPRPRAVHAPMSGRLAAAE